MIGRGILLKRSRCRLVGIFAFATVLVRRQAFDRARCGTVSMNCEHVDFVERIQTPRVEVQQHRLCVQQLHGQFDYVYARIVSIQFNTKDFLNHFSVHRRFGRLHVNDFVRDEAHFRNEKRKNRRRFRLPSCRTTIWFLFSPGTEEILGRSVSAAR